MQHSLVSIASPPPTPAHSNTYIYIYGYLAICQPRPRAATERQQTHPNRITRLGSTAPRASPSDKRSTSSSCPVCVYMSTKGLPARDVFYSATMMVGAAGKWRRRRKSSSLLLSFFPSSHAATIQNSHQPPYMHTSSLAYLLSFIQPRLIPQSQHKLLLFRSRRSRAKAPFSLRGARGTVRLSGTVQGGQPVVVTRRSRARARRQFVRGARGTLRLSGTVQGAPLITDNLSLSRDGRARERGDNL